MGGASLGRVFLPARGGADDRVAGVSDLWAALPRAAEVGGPHGPVAPRAAYGAAALSLLRELQEAEAKEYRELRDYYRSCARLRKPTRPPLVI